MKHFRVSSEVYFILRNSFFLYRNRVFQIFKSLERQTRLWVSITLINIVKVRWTVSLSCVPKNFGGLDFLQIVPSIWAVCVKSESFLVWLKIGGDSWFNQEYFGVDSIHN